MKKITYGGAKISSGVGQSEGWNDEFTKELLNKMKQAITKPDITKYKTQLEKFDWSKVNVEKFTPQQCKSQWEKIYKKLRKFKTLSDLIQDSLEYIENPYKGCVKKHPDHPKRPLTPYFRYFLSEREKYAATHKNLSNLEITTILSKKYREITELEKEKYMDEWKTEMVEYRHKMEQFKNEHPEYYDKDPPTLSRTPLQIFNQESLDSMSQSTNMTKKQIAESLKNKYHKLDDDQKLPYIMKAIEEWEKYKEELEMFKKSHPDFSVSATQKKSVLTIADWRIHDKSLGKPARPPANGYNLFCTRMMVSDSMKHLTSRDRIMECGQKWKLLMDSEKQAYQKEFLRLRDNYRLDLKRFIRALTPRQKEEYFRRKKENENKKNKKRKVATKVKQELSGQSNVSDEDDDDEDEEDQNTSSSDSSSSEESSEEEEEEEEEEESPQTENGASSPVSPPLRPTTPISALFLYQKVHREKFAQKNPNMSKSDITIMLARRFNNLPHEKKLKYIQKEKEQRDMYNEQMRKHQMGEKNGSNSKNPSELKPITGEQVYHDQNRENYLKKSNGNKEKAEEAMRRAWTHMNKERRKKFINIAHEKNAKNIAEHLAAQAAAKESNKQITSVPERNLSQKEIKSYLALEPTKVPRDSLTLFRKEHKQKLNHLMPNARNKELIRIWNGMPTNVKNHYKERVKAGIAEYNKKLQRWLKSLPPQAREVYDATMKKKSEKRKAENGGAKKRKTEAKSSGTKAKKVKIKGSQDAESSGHSSDGEKQDSSSDDSDDESGSSSDSNGSSSNSNSSDSDVPKESSSANQAGTAQEDESSGDSSSSSSSSGEDSDSD